MKLEAESEYWRWKEYNWSDPDINWQNADIIAAGIDVGSVSSQAVIVSDGKLLGYSNLRTGSNSPDSAQNALNWALKGIEGLSQDKIQYLVGTGYGRVNIPISDKAITEIACHARGANYIYGPKVKTVLDMGGQDCKAINCDDRGKVTAFLMNDKCAAGTGRGMEVFADLLGVHIEKVGELSLDVVQEPPPVSSTCVVFAKSEATALLRTGWSKNQVLASYCSAMSHRVVTLLERIEMIPEFAITGGISKNVGVVNRLVDELNVKAMDPGDLDPQIAGGLGAALFAEALVKKQRKMAG
ncbi:MAG: benzoyl-CoA reductase, bzd-type, subunit Q [Candidatus Kariarchaeaceae archaeon]|jgi:bzd-type benzoyl-CoA reductase Q subunit